MDPQLIKTIHVMAVAISGTGFFARGLGGLLGAPWVRGRLARTVPHIVDSVLLISALALAWSMRVTPANAPWLTAKIVGLLLYIGLGMIALRPAWPLVIRAVAWIVALASFGWIISVAMLKNPLGILALLL